MEVTKLSISPETLTNSLLTPKKKRQLRRENILAYIRNKPVGEPIRMKDLISVASYSSQKNGQQMVCQLIKQMTKEKLITNERIVGSHSWRFTVLTDAKTVVPPQMKEKSDKPNIENLAKEFAWQYNSNDLREFIKWLQKSDNAT